MKKLILSISLFLFLFNTSFSQTQIKVRVFNDYKLTQLLIEPTGGVYTVYSGKDELLTLKKNKIIYLIHEKNAIIVRNEKEIIGKYTSISIIQEKGGGDLRVFPAEPKYNPELKTRIYEHHFHVTLKDNQLILINQLNVESYIAGVVQAFVNDEAATEEYCKTIALMARNSLFFNLIHYKSFNYDVSDTFPDMPYLGKCENEKYKKATHDTHSKVVVDMSKNIIEPVYHLNSGGQTLNSEEVFDKKISYLRGIKDNFSDGQPNEKWREILPISTWTNYLAKEHGVVLPDDFNKSNFAFDQKVREKYYLIRNDSIPIDSIVNYFHFKSDLFSISVFKNTLIFKGVGVGHAVGLSLEGAKNMAAKGETYDKIIKLYYRNVSIMKAEDLPKVKIFYKK